MSSCIMIHENLTHEWYIFWIIMSDWIIWQVLQCRLQRGPRVLSPEWWPVPLLSRTNHPCHQPGNQNQSGIQSVDTTDMALISLARMSYWPAPPPPCTPAPASHWPPTVWPSCPRPVRPDRASLWPPRSPSPPSPLPQSPSPRSKHPMCLQ